LGRAPSTKPLVTMTQEIQDRINQALDDAMESFRDDPDCIFSTEVERLQLKYRDRPKVNAWKKNKNCIYDNCTNKSILKSHTNQKSSSIKII